MKDENGDNVFCEFCRYWRVKSEVAGVRYGACDHQEVEGGLVKVFPGMTFLREIGGNAVTGPIQYFYGFRLRTRADFGCNRFERRNGDG